MRAFTEQGNPTRGGIVAKKSRKSYGLPEQKSAGAVAAPDLPYQPQSPKKYKPVIGLIACGGITQQHLTAYRRSGFNVVALCDLIEDRAKARQKEFFPSAKVYTDYREVLKRDDIDVVDIATHPPERAPLIKAAIEAGKHVLSQKPFVIDLDLGERLCDLADRKGVKLAVNQNGRWAPHVSYTRLAVAKGLLGDVFGVHMSGHFDHNWVAKHPVFNTIHHIILFDYAIHWFDMINCYTPGKRATRVYASATKASGQKARPPLLGQAVIEFEDGQASLAFDGATRFGSFEHGFVVGTKGSILYSGKDLQTQNLSISTPGGTAKVDLAGSWFPGGFHGTMGELLCAIEEKRTPSNNARGILRSLEMCFAACRAADTGKPQVPGKVRTIKP
jgi:predicted dehydrogenase